MFKKIVVTIALFVVGLCVAFGSSVFAQSNRPVTPPANSQINPVTPPANTQINRSQINRGQINAGQISEIDRQFVMTAAEAGIGNLQMGQLALQRATNAQARQFAQAEIAEQTNIMNNLSQIAPRLGMTLPTTPNPKFQASLRQLSQIPGQQFDQAYMNEGGVNAHLENAANFQREAAFGQNPDLVRLATAGLPTINQHFTTASAATNYRFAQVSQRFNGTPSASQVQPVAPRTPSDQ